MARRKRRGFRNGNKDLATTAPGDAELPNQDFCRVCRAEPTQQNPLFHPCICTGSIKWVHQDCLTQWMQYSKKEYCELCRYKYAFMPMYHENMPKRLPLRDILAGLCVSSVIAVKCWLRYSIVVFTWLGLVPLLAARIFQCLFSAKYNDMSVFPRVLLSLDNIVGDMVFGMVIVALSLLAFIALVWLREQILNGDAPDWLDQDDDGGGMGHIENDGGHALDDGEEDDDFDEFDNFEDELDLELVEQNNFLFDDHINWNPVEWDRPDELTWERLLGLDGSLVFLEHVFWVVSLNTLFIFLFVFVPYHIGSMFVAFINVNEYVSSLVLEGFVYIVLGYLLFCFALVLLYGCLSLTHYHRISRVIGISFIVTKVMILFTFELGAMPFLCGWWLDICSFPFFNVTLKDRHDYFVKYPLVSIFIHWIVGMVFVYYFAVFVLTVREVLRPGVLWFLRNLNDPDISPVQEMIRLSVFSHIRRVMLSCIIFGLMIMLLLYFPAKILKFVDPTFLPFIMVPHTELASELSAELILLQLVFPALLEQHYVKMWTRTFIRRWCIVVSRQLGLTSYLLGDLRNPPPPPPPPVNLNGDQGIGAVHHALMLHNVHHNTGYVPYKRPKRFVLRIIALMVLISVTILMMSLTIISLPVVVGRWFVRAYGRVMLKQGPAGDGVFHEVYSVAAGVYIVWIIGRLIVFTLKWMPKGKWALLKRMARFMVFLAKSLYTMFWVLGVIPYLMGMLLSLTITSPLVNPLDKTPVVWMSKDWIFGVICTKLIVGLLLTQPYDFEFKRHIERTVRNGIHRMKVWYTTKNVFIPVVWTQLRMLCLPYAIAYGLVPSFVDDWHTIVMIQRRAHPFGLFAVCAMLLICLKIRLAIQLYNHIRNERYLIGRKLVNYDHDQKERERLERERKVKRRR